jgi:hypothetical protein
LGTLSLVAVSAKIVTVPAPFALPAMSRRPVVVTAPKLLME